MWCSNKFKCFQLIEVGRLLFNFPINNAVQGRIRKISHRIYVQLIPQQTLIQCRVPFA